MIDLRVRACLKCKEYVVINPDDPINQFRITKFEKLHKGHMLSTLDYREISDGSEKYLDKSMGVTTENIKAV